MMQIPKAWTAQQCRTLAAWFAMIDQKLARSDSPQEIAAARKSIGETMEDLYREAIKREFEARKGQG